MIENIRLSFQGIWSHKMRSFLTMLGIIIGIASIISIVSTIKGTNEQIKNNLIGAGNNTVEIKLNQGDGEYYIEYNGIPVGISAVDNQVLDRIRKIEHLDSASVYQIRQSVYEGVYYQDVSFTGGQILGIDEAYFDTCGYIFRMGRDFKEDEFKAYRKNVILDKDAADSMMQDENPLGKTVEIMGEPFTVIGVVEKAKKFEPVINTIDEYYEYKGYEASGTIFVPDSTWPIIYQYDEPQNVVIKASGTDYMNEVSKKGADILNEKVSNEDGIKYKADNFLEQAKQLQELSKATNNQLLWIASISLLVGGIGVMNIMLVSVTERTREIGLKKAIGARKGRIMIQFLTEASVLTCMGGIIGIFVGVGLAQVISKLTETPVAISVPAIIGAVVFSTLIGIIFGLLPSFKAASLNPIDALRYE